MFIPKFDQKFLEAIPLKLKTRETVLDRLARVSYSVQKGQVTVTVDRND